MATEAKHDTLQTIFSFFLGLMVVAFIGVGVNTFYESPSARYEPQLQKLYNEQNSYDFKQPNNLSSSEQAKLDAVRKQIQDLQTKQQEEMQGWQINTGIVLVLFATAVMAVSLVRSEQLRVISNGLLLGGLFTMIYGTGMSAFSGNSKVRFFVIALALAVTLGLGYVKFVRGRTRGAPPTDEAGAVVSTPDAAPPPAPPASEG
ncbi:MAG TPA: hypothetical protein VF902_04235 [Coriobacteriia bacterium]